MKRVIKDIILFIVIILLSSCGKKSYVIFDYNCNGQEYHKCELKNNKLNCKVETPTCGEYKFKGWYKANEYKNQVDLNGTFNKNEIIYARWEENGQIIESSSQELVSTIITPDVIDMPSSSVVEEPSSSQIEYSSQEEPSSQQPVPETTYTISFNLNGGSGGQSSQISGVKYGSNLPAISQTKPTKSGYTFLGWYDSQTGGTQYYNSSNSPVKKYDKKSNITLYAQWRINVLSIQYNGNGGSWDSTNSTYGVNSSGTVIVKSTNQVYTQKINYGSKIESGGLIDYNGSWFKWKKDGYIVESKKEYILGSTVLDQAKVYSSIDLARYSGCDLSKSDCLVTVKVNWKKNTYDMVDYSKFKWTPYKEKSGPVAAYYSNVIDYAIWAPENIDDLNGVSLPLIVWLHGAGEMSYTISINQYVNTAFPKVIKEWNKHKLKPIPAIIVAPQSAGRWIKNTPVFEKNIESIKALIEYAKAKYNIDTKNIVLMGHSLGGNGVVNMSYEMQKRYSHDYFNKLIIMSGTESLEYPSNDLVSGYNYFSKKEVRGYTDIYNTDCEKFFIWIGKPENYKLYKNTSHGDIPEKALAEDLNEDGISDLIYWAINGGK